MAHNIRRAIQHGQPLYSTVTQQAVRYITFVESLEACGLLVADALICMVTARCARPATTTPVSPVKSHTNSAMIARSVFALLVTIPSTLFNPCDLSPTREPNRKTWFLESLCNHILL